jgi:hypothetical protein
MMSPVARAEAAARRHASDEHAGVERVSLHPDAIAEDRAARVRARRVHRDDADGRALRPQMRREPIDQRRLARARRSRHTEHVGAAGVRVDRADDVGDVRQPVLDARDQAGQRQPIAGQHPADTVRHRIRRDPRRSPPSRSQVSTRRF